MGASPTRDETARDHAANLGDDPAPISDFGATPPAHPDLTTTKWWLIYDGDCGFCSAAARWVDRRLGEGYRVVPSQQADLHVLGLTDDDVARSVWWIDPDGRRWDEHRGIAQALGALGGPWPWLGRLLTLRPMGPPARWIYRRVAHNRHRLRRPGASPTCRR